jgi:hypothetical protein
MDAPPPNGKSTYALIGHSGAIGTLDVITSEDGNTTMLALVPDAYFKVNMHEQKLEDGRTAYLIEVSR